MNAQLLTHSRQQAFKVCRKQHWFGYELGIRRDLDGKALRMGSAYHDGLEALAKTGELSEACYAARKPYEAMPENFDALEWEYERETVERMICGYEWRWSNAPLEHIATEQTFQLPLVNPETGKASPLWKLAGKIDGIVRLEDGRLAVIEHKLFGDDISPDSDLWRRMRIDHQVSLYVYAARQLGYEVATVLYNVARKPTIKPCPVPVLDELGVKIVLDAKGERVWTKDNSKWRTTADTALGYVVQTEPMSPAEWGDKLSADIVERPEFYFSRVEVPRLDSDLAEYQQELWEIAQTMREAQRNDRWYRTAHKNTCDFCSYFPLCTTGNFDPNGTLPEGYVRVYDLHPELGGMTNDNHHTEETTTATAVP